MSTLLESLTSSISKLLSSIRYLESLIISFLLSKLNMGLKSKSNIIITIPLLFLDPKD